MTTFFKVVAYTLIDNAQPDLIPLTLTPAGLIGEVREGTLERIALVVEERIQTKGYVGDFGFYVGDAFERVEALYVNGLPENFAVNATDQYVNFSPLKTLTSSANITIVLRPQVTFTLINGQLPPGMTINPSTGVIAGVVGNILDGPVDYRFTIRISNATHTHDRTFIIRGHARDYPVGFFLPGLMPFDFDATIREGGLAYKKLATLERGDAFAYTLDIDDLDGVLPPLTVHRVTGLTYNASLFGGMPPDFDLVGTNIQGIVSAEACPGRYFFEVRIHDPAGASSFAFMIEIKDSVGPQIGVIPEIFWETPEGDLGDIVETDPSYFVVKARAIASPPILYTLSRHSDPLPQGIRLDPATGRLMGTFPHVTADRRFTITIRAQAGSIFVDRTFWITVLNRFDKESIHILTLRMRVTEKVDLLPDYRRLLPVSSVYRFDDTNFGYVKEPSVYVIKGLDGDGNLEAAIRGDGTPSIVWKDYHHPFRFILGTHHFSVIRDSKGNVICDVLWRELYDPQTRAGGFNRNAGNTVVEELVQYPQDRTLAVYPNSIRNIRRDLVNDIGFATNNASMRMMVGANEGGELQPLWMRSEQTLGDDTSVLGFRLGFVIAYLLPDQRRDVSRLLNEHAKELVNDGRTYYFDKYFTNGTELISQTTYFADGDDNSHTDVAFDGLTTMFDGTFSEIVKYLE